MLPFKIGRMGYAADKLERRYMEELDVKMIIEKVAEHLKDARRIA